MAKTDLQKLLELKNEISDSGIPNINQYLEILEKLYLSGIDYEEIDKIIECIFHLVDITSYFKVENTINYYDRLIEEYKELLENLSKIQEKIIHTHEIIDKN